MRNCKLKQTVVYIHGKGGNARESEHFKTLFKECEVIGFDYKSETPWEAEKEFKTFANELCRKVGSFILVANSIGAYYSMLSFAYEQVGKAYFISPIVDMEKLIEKMMLLSDITEEQLKKQKSIPTGFGETLSWDYLRYVRENLVKWNVPTEILYGEKDNLTSYETITAFALRGNAQLTIMKGGEHWFHTKEQMQFLDDWIVGSI